MTKSDKSADFPGGITKQRYQITSLKKYIFSKEFLIALFRLINKKIVKNVMIDGNNSASVPYICI